MAALRIAASLMIVAIIMCGVDAWGSRPWYYYKHWSRVLDSNTTGIEVAKVIPRLQVVVIKPARNDVFNWSYIMEDYPAGKLAIKIPTTRGPYCFIFDTISTYNQTVEDLKNRQTLKTNGESVPLGEAPDYIAEGKINGTTLYRMSRRLYKFCYFALWRRNVYQLFDETEEEFETTVYDGFSWPVVGLYAPFNILLSTTIPIPPPFWWQ